MFIDSGYYAFEPPKNTCVKKNVRINNRIHWDIGFFFVYCYWIYNLMCAVFFQNLNVYLRKTYTIVLFKVLPIWIYDFFPYFWQFVDSIPKELRRLGGQEWIKSIFDFLFWCEPYYSEGVLHRQEQMVVRRGKVWAIRWVGSNFPSTVFQIVLNRNSNMGPSVFMMENYCLVSVRIFRAFFAHCSLKTD